MFSCDACKSLRRDNGISEQHDHPGRNGNGCCDDTRRAAIVCWCPFPTAVFFVRGVSDTRRVGDGVRQVMLLINTCKQVRHRTARVDRHILAAVRLVSERHVHRLLKLVRLCTSSSSSTTRSLMR